MMRLASLLLLALPTVLAKAAGPTWTVNSYEQAIMLGVEFTDSNTGYIAGGDNGVGASVVKTADGGNTWSTLQIHQPALLFSSIASTSAESVVANGIGLVGFGGTQYTTDGTVFTNSSEVFEGHSVDYQQSQSVSTIGDVPGAYAVVGNFGFWNVTAHSNMLLLSADGGATFDFQDLGTMEPVHARYSSFPSTSVGFVASGCWPPNERDTLSKQRHLSARIHVHVDGDKQSIHATPREQFNTATAGWVGIIQRSTDGFQTFQTVFQNDTYYFNQISCPSEQVCFAVAENYDFGYVFKSSDAGETWDQLLALTNISIMAISALSEEEVFIGGGLLAQSGIEGHVLHSTDGGATFQTTIIPGQYIMDMDFIDSTHGFAVAANIQGSSNLLIYA